jgi:hypothetical protein
VLGYLTPRDLAAGFEPAADSSPAEVILWHCVQALTETLSITSPASMARVQRISRLAAGLGAACGTPKPDLLARLAFVSQLRTLTLPEKIVLKMHRGRLLTEDERRIVRTTPDLGGHLLARIPGMEAGREIVRLHDVHEVPVLSLPLESAVLRVAIGYDRLEAGGKSPDEAVSVLRERDPMYDPHVLHTLETYIAHTHVNTGERTLAPCDLVPGMVLTRDVTTSDGSLLLGAGHELTAIIIQRLSGLANRRVIHSSVVVALDQNAERPASVDVQGV